MNIEKEYFAFISYQRKDEEWAERLRNKLEHYRLPSSVRKRDASLPKEIRPIFRDALELAGGILAKEIETALKQSKFLIVICSPNSAKSPWVNKEIQTFIDLGREEHIIPFIIEGTPFSNDAETECFPPALRSLKGEKELLGININELSRDAASIKVVARMFGLKFDALWHRYEREKRKLRMLILGGALLLAITGVSIAVGFSQQNKRIREQNERITKQNQDIIKKNERLYNDSIVMAAQMDSINKRDALIQQQQDSIETTNANLEITNKQLTEERNNLRIANWKMMENRNRIVAEKAQALIDDGDSYMAQMLALEALSSGPYVPELEFVLRQASQFDNAILRGHTEGVRKAACSPDGKLIASASYDNTVRIWEVQTGMCTHVLKGHDSGVVCVTFSPDGEQVVSGSVDKTIRVWDVETGHCTHVLSGQPSGIEGLFFCTDGKTLISYSADVYLGDLGTVIFWDYPNKKCRKKTSCEYVDAVSPDGKFYAYHSYESGGNSHDWHINSIETGKELCCLKGLQEWSRIAFSHDGKLVATGCSGERDNFIRIWDMASGKCLKETNNIDKSTIFSLSFSPDDLTLLAACGGHQLGCQNDIRFWRKNVPYEDWVFENELKGHSDHVYDAFFSPDMSRIISASADQTVRIWDQGKGDIQRTITTGVVHAAMISPDGKSVASTCDLSKDTTFIWNEYDSIPIEGHPFTMPAFSPDGTKFVSADYEGTVGLWATATGKCIMRMNGHEDVVNSVSYSPDGELVASASDDASIRLWDARTGKCVGILNDQNTALSVCFSPDGKQLISGSGDANIQVWDIKSKTCKQIIHGHTEPINSVDYSSDGKYIVSAANDSTIRLWDGRTGQFIRFIGQRDDVTFMVRFSPDSRSIISVGESDDLAKVWDVESGQCLQTLGTTFIPALDGRGYQIRCAMFNPNGTEIIGLFQEGPANIYFWRYPPFGDVINRSREHFQYRLLTPEERRKYYLE